MEAARHDRLVWTDDDFHHPPDWLATLSADYEEDRLIRTYRTDADVMFEAKQKELAVLRCRDAAAST